MAFVRRQLWPAVGLTLALTLITGILYPLAVTVIAQVAFPAQANGSLITAADGQVVGSRLIGQAFSEPQYFWGRLSAAGADGYDANASAAPTWVPRTPRSSSASRPTWRGCVPRTAMRRSPATS